MDGGRRALKPDSFEKRREPRFRLNQPVSISIQGPSKSQSGVGGIIDLSEHGLSFTFIRRLDAGDFLTVQYEGCVVLGQVRNCRVREFAQERRYLIGVAVTKVVQGEETWRRLIEQCCAGA